MNPKAARDEGVLLAEFAGRLVLKNRILMVALTSGERYEAVRYLDDARAALDDLIRQSQAAEQRVTDELAASAQLPPTRPRHMHDYRSIDHGNLERRKQLHSDVARRLRELRADESYLINLIELAREEAWRELSKVLEQGVVSVWSDRTLDEDYDTERYRRLRALEQDLSALMDKKSLE